MKKTAITLLVVILIAVLFCGCARYGTGVVDTDTPDVTLSPMVPPVTVSPRVTATPRVTVAPRTSPRLGDGEVRDTDGIIGDTDTGARKSATVLP